jgi:two-component system response regulator FlrC
MDEIGELKATSQAKLLRVLEEQTFQRVGGSQSIRIDVRWVAATNRDLPRMMAEGTFREDLYHRLAVFPVNLPPLRERPEDIVPLAQLLLRRVGGEIGRPGLVLADDAAAALQNAPWPGNVRELRNTLERASIMAEGSVINAPDLGFVPAPRAASGAANGAHARASGASGAGASGGSAGAAVGDPEAMNGVLALKDLERIAIERALKATGGNRKDAAERLGIGLRTLYEKLKLYGIN